MSEPSIDPPGLQGLRCELLPAGTIEVVDPIRLRPNTLLAGTVVDGELQTRLRRGSLADGTLYRGPLVVCEGVGNAGLRSLVIDGRRFEGSAGAFRDHRHPLSPDRADARFPLTQPVPEGEVPEHRHYAVPFAADVLCVDSHGLRFDNLRFEYAIVIGLAVGPRCGDVGEHGCDFVAAGEIGLWAGGNLGLPTVPLSERDREVQPSQLTVAHCRFERTGASAVHLDARAVTLAHCVLKQNHCDFPYNESGGQVCIDYKSSGVLIDRCRVEEGPWLRRPVAGASGAQAANSLLNLSHWPQEGILHIWSRATSGLYIVFALVDFREFQQTAKPLGACGLEVAGENIKIVDTVVSGNAAEAIHFDGARNVWICGADTRLCANQQWVRTGALVGALEDIAVTQSAAMAGLNAVTADIYVAGVALDAGVIVWSDGAVPDLRIPRLFVRNLVACGGAPPRVRVHNNAAGRPLLGSDSSV